MYTIANGIDVDLIRKYSCGYMYVDYPHKSKWSYDFNEDDYMRALSRYCRSSKKPSAMLYVHIPFCFSLCAYCLCHKIITREEGKIRRYLERLFQEIDLLMKYFDEAGVHPNIREIHLGGGTPTILGEKDFDRLVAKLQGMVGSQGLREFTIEVDPRHSSLEMLRYYHSKGIDRLSFGVQDFDLSVQEAVNRVQRSELVASLLAPDIRRLFKSVNFDILCGLPRQTRETFKETIDTVIKMAPDRIDLAFVNYTTKSAKNQRLIDRSECPDEVETHMLFLQASRQLIDGGYVRIGFDHFARPSDEVAAARDAKALRWNGLGYAPGSCVDVIGVGLNSTSRLTADYYAQNVYDLTEYDRAIESGRFPILRGYKLSKDDVLRRNIINELRSYNTIDRERVEEAYRITFEDYFANEMLTLNRFVSDGLVTVTDEEIRITEKGLLFVNSICWIFDGYKGQVSYPKRGDGIHGACLDGKAVG